MRHAGFDSAELKALVAAIACGDRDDFFTLVADVHAANCNAANEFGGTELVLCLRSPGRAERRGRGKKSFQLLSELLLAEYEQNLALASKEDELNHMTDELTRRYEELNLIYKAEDQAMNIYHGRELLRQLVMNTSRFLNVDIIYLYIAGKNIAMHKFRGDNPVFQADALFRCLRETVQPMLARTSDAIGDQPYRRGAAARHRRRPAVQNGGSPVVNVDSEVIGLLAIASQNFAVDFSNSDRNLLDVMSKKASKIAQSHFDPLTGLENSNSFELILKDLLKQSWGMDVHTRLPISISTAWRWSTTSAAATPAIC